MTAARKKIRRVALTGGPAAGKTAVLDVLRRHLQGSVVVLPEAATTLFTGGFPRPKDPAGLRLLQKTIYSVQRNMEEIYALEDSDLPHICDRGALDGAAYWPGGLDRFLGAMGTTLESEYERYEAVLFLETSAYDEKAYSVDNPYRIETPAKARKIDQQLQRIWRDHPAFHLIGHETNFYEKVAVVLIKLHALLGVDNGSDPAVAQRARRSSKRSPKKGRAKKRRSRKA